MATWIFQGNPKTFDIDGYLEASPGLILWRVSKYAEQINIGDTVYVWRSQAGDADSAGIVAEGTVVEDPEIQPDDSVAQRFWKVLPESAMLMRVKIRVNRIAAKREMLKRDWMKEDSILQSMLIMRQAAGTNFPVTEREAIRLGQLWRKTGRSWSRDEIVAAIWLYDRLFEKPISKTAGSEIERLSQQIGRAPTGLYNKLMNLRALDPRASQQGLKGGSKLDQLTWQEFFSPISGYIDRSKLEAEFQRLWGGDVVADEPPNANLEVEVARLEARSTEDLLELYGKRPKNTAPKRRSQASTVYDRDPLVVALRKKLAGYQCEVENCPSPKFTSQSGDLYVEVHHIVPLAEGGPDTLENTAALCPTHHRLLHVGNDRADVIAALAEKRKSS